jgi:hypothetical protein
MNTALQLAKSRGASLQIHAREIPFGSSRFERSSKDISSAGRLVRVAVSSRTLRAHEACAAQCSTHVSARPRAAALLSRHGYIGMQRALDAPYAGSQMRAKHARLLKRKLDAM